MPVGTQDGRNCCQDGTLEVSRDSHSLSDPPIGGPRAGLSGVTCKWGAHVGRSYCQDWTLKVDRGSHSLRGHPLRGPELGPVEEPAKGGARGGETAAKVGLWSLIWAPTASGTPHRGPQGWVQWRDQPDHRHRHLKLRNWNWTRGYLDMEELKLEKLEDETEELDLNLGGR